MKKLLSLYGFESAVEYYNTIAESFMNGQRSQCCEQFKAMPRRNRKDCIIYLSSNSDAGLSDPLANYLIDLL